jgi:hypothetical protein
MKIERYGDKSELFIIPIRFYAFSAGLTQAV